jgi:hypothetical protein
MSGKNWDTRRTFMLIIGATAAGFASWVGGLFLVWIALRLLGVSTSFWAMTEALSTAVAAAAVLGAGYVAYRELDEIANSRHLDVADRLFDELNSPDNIEARRWVFQNLANDPEAGIPSLPPEGRAAVKRVLNSLDRAAFLTQSGWIPDELIMPWMNPMIVKAWAKLEPYVDYEAKRRQEPDYYLHARQLAERCRTWRRTHLPHAELTWLDDAL